MPKNPLSQSCTKPIIVMETILTTSQENIIVMLQLQNLVYWRKFQAALESCTLALNCPQLSFMSVWFHFLNPSVWSIL